jgi:hypothetical protein
MLVALQSCRPITCASFKVSWKLFCLTSIKGSCSGFSGGIPNGLSPRANPSQIKITHADRQILTLDDERDGVVAVLEGALLEIGLLQVARLDVGGCKTILKNSL